MIIVQTGKSPFQTRGSWLNVSSPPAIAGSRTPDGRINRLRACRAPDPEARGLRAMGKRRAPDLMASGLRAVGTTTSMLVWRRYKRAEPPKMLTLRNAAGTCDNTCPSRRGGNFGNSSSRIRRTKGGENDPPTMIPRHGATAAEDDYMISSRPSTWQDKRTISHRY